MMLQKKYNHNLVCLHEKTPLWSGGLNVVTILRGNSTFCCLKNAFGGKQSNPKENKNRFNVVIQSFIYLFVLYSIQKLSGEIQFFLFSFILVGRLCAGGRWRVRGCVLEGALVRV